MHLLLWVVPIVKGLHLGPGCLLLPARGLHVGPGCLLLLAQGLCRGLATFFGLPMNYVEDLDAYLKAMVANMNYNLVVLVPPAGTWRRSSTATRWWCWPSPALMWKEELYCNKMVVLVLPARIWKEELYYNKMMVLFYPSMDMLE